MVFSVDIFDEAPFRISHSLDLFAHTRKDLLQSGGCYAVRDVAMVCVPSKGRGTANQYFNILSDHLYPVMIGVVCQCWKLCAVAGQLGVGLL